MKRALIYGCICTVGFIFFSCGNEPSKPKQGELNQSLHDHNHHNSHSFSNKPTYADSINEGLIAVDTLKSSVRRVAMANVEDCHVHIEYGSPGVRGRTIWGGLVAYNEVWAAGAHSATSIRFSKPVEINGTRVAAETYGFFAIPGIKQWTLILNSNYKQHLADEYTEDEDVVRIQSLPVKNKVTQRLTYLILPGTNKNEGEIVLLWDSLRVGMPFKVLP